MAFGFIWFLSLEDLQQYSSPENKLPTRNLLFKNQESSYFFLHLEYCGPHWMYIILWTSQCTTVWSKQRISYINKMVSAYELRNCFVCLMTNSWWIMECFGHDTIIGSRQGGKLHQNTIFSNFGIWCEIFTITTLQDLYGALMLSNFKVSAPILLRV